MVISVSAPAGRVGDRMDESLMNSAMVRVAALRWAVAGFAERIV